MKNLFKGYFPYRKKKNKEKCLKCKTNCYPKFEQKHTELPFEKCLSSDIKHSFFQSFHPTPLKSLKCYGIFYHTVGKILLSESSTYFLSFHFLHFELSTDTISVCFSVYRVWYPPKLLSRAICYRQRLLSTKCGSKTDSRGSKSDGEEHPTEKTPGPHSVVQ